MFQIIHQLIAPKETMIALFVVCENHPYDVTDIIFTESHKTRVRIKRCE